MDEKTEGSLRGELEAIERQYPADPGRRGEKREVFVAKDKLRRQIAALEERKATLKEMRQLGCPSLPTPPNEGCGTYFKQTDPEKTKAAEREWKKLGDGHKAQYAIWRENMGRPLANGEKVNHVVPMSAGGCPKGGRNDEGFPNLVPDSDIKNPRCLELDGPKNPRLGRAQAQAFSHWSGVKK